jgi:Cdc6-like AAA superfamily ATPase
MKYLLQLIQDFRVSELLLLNAKSAIFQLYHGESKNYIIIIGGPGSGKTATARHIALELEDQEWEVVPVCRLDEIIQYGDRDHKQVFVLQLIQDFRVSE